MKETGQAHRYKQCKNWQDDNNIWFLVRACLRCDTSSFLWTIIIVIVAVCNISRAVKTSLTFCGERLFKSLRLHRSLPVPLPSTGSDQIIERQASCLSVCFQRATIMFHDDVVFAAPHSEAHRSGLRCLKCWQTPVETTFYSPFYFQGNMSSSENRLVFSLYFFLFSTIFIISSHSPCLTLGVFTLILIYYELMNFPHTAAARVISACFFFFCSSEWIRSAVYGWTMLIHTHTHTLAQAHTLKIVCVYCTCRAGLKRATC